VAFKIIVEYTKARQDPKLIEFSLKALEIFKNRLPEWP